MGKKEGSLADKAYAAIRAGILSGRIGLGKKISEDSLAEELGVSRTPIREALRRLSEEGLVMLYPRSHAAVASISPDDAENVRRLRLVLEDFAIAEMDAERFRAEEEHLVSLAEECTLDAMRGNRAAALESDSRFHIGLITASGNKALATAYQKLDAMIQLSRLANGFSEEKLIAHIGEHLPILRFISDGRIEEAKALMKEHIVHED